MQTWVCRALSCSVPEDCEWCVQWHYIPQVGRNMFLCHQSDQVACAFNLVISLVKLHVLSLHSLKYGLASHVALSQEIGSSALS